VSATLDSAAFTSGTLVSSSGSHTLVVSATDKATNAASETVEFSISPPSGPPIFSPGLCAGSITLTDNAVIAPKVDGGQPLLFNSAGALSGKNNVLVEGSGIAAGNLTWSDNANLTGTLTVGGTQTVGAQASIGTLVIDAGFTSPCCPFDAGAALLAASTNNDNANLPQSISSLVTNKVLTVSSGSVSFPSGDYYFASITVKNTGKISVAQNAMVTLYSQGDVTVQDQGILSGSSQSLQSLTVISGGNISLTSGQISASDAGITLIGNFVTNGLFYSAGTATLSQSTELFGGLGAQTGATLSVDSQLIVPPALIPSNGQVTCQ
jgi:hypothetical protein